ncbi:hypothetical protein ACYSNL_02065 [Enterococcus cecorum]
MIEINKKQHKQITVHEKICAIEARLYHIEKQHEVTQKLLFELLGVLKNGSFEIDTIEQLSHEELFMLSPMERDILENGGKIQL